MTTTTTNKEDELHEIGRRAYESIAEMVAKLAAFEKDDNGEDTDEPDEKAREAAREEIEQDPLSVQVRSGWHSLGEDPGAPDEFEILLATGGPAVRIIGELNQYGDPTHARLQTQNWFTPWTDYVAAERDVLLTYCAVFYFGGGR